MKKVLLTAAASCLLSQVTLAQTQQRMPCGSDEIKAHLIKTLPGYQQQVQDIEQQNLAGYQAYVANLQAQRASGTQSTVTYTIPVVFHVLHTNGTENRTDADCIAALNNVNLDYARAKSDTAFLDPLYEPLYVNSHIKFVLAKKDPQGNCTTGIVHHYDENTQWKENAIYNYIYSTVGTYNWKPSRYLNVYVVDNIIGDIQAGVSIGGYTFRPGTAPNIGADAVVLSDELLMDPGSKGLSHEIGHWLGLAHTFDGNGGFRTPESTNNVAPFGVGFVCGNDDVADTPKTPGFLSICPAYITLLDSCDPGKRPNIHNIMDYATCPIMFTQGQTDRMRFTLGNSVANRDYLVSNKNLSIVGVLNETYTVNPNNNLDTLAFAYSVAPNTICSPIADFYANRGKSCQGQAVIYNSTSFNNATGLSYSWQFEGGAPATSTLSTPSVTYAAPGNYSTTLTITNTNGTSTKVRNPFPNVSWHVDQANYPALEGFEANLGGLLPGGWQAINKNFGSITWQIANYGSNSSKCIMLANANGQGMTGPEDLDLLETGQYNFSNTTNITISYDYSYARKPGATGDVFKFEYSLDCGGNWLNMATTQTADQLSATSGGTLTAPYVPLSQDKWKNKLYNSTAILNNKPDVKFRFTFQNTSLANAQNFYLDNFNISGTVGLEELESSIGLSIYPNPTSSSSTLEFSSPVDAKVNVSVYDVTGRIVEASDFNAAASNTTKYQVNKNSSLKAGIYFVSLTLNNQKITKKLIVE
jgi:PKD repeat protein